MDKLRADLANKRAADERTKKIIDDELARVTKATGEFWDRLAAELQRFASEWNSGARNEDNVQVTSGEVQTKHPVTAQAKKKKNIDVSIGSGKLVRLFREDDAEGGPAVHGYVGDRSSVSEVNDFKIRVPLSEKSDEAVQDVANRTFRHLFGLSKWLG